jgi:NTP pyrophosphatase (non-canonical NTP hydrolase)
MKHRKYYDFVVSYTHVFGTEKDQQHWMLGALDEFGEVLGLFKKSLFKEVSKAKFIDEIGDVLFYLNMGLFHTSTKFTKSTFTQVDDIFEIITLYNWYWRRKDISGMYCCILNICKNLDIDIKDAYEMNYDKLTARHEGEFNINNKKHTKKEQDVIK